MKLKIEDLDQISEVAAKFLSLAGDNRIFAFYGSMGAGKTTFIKALCQELGAVDVVTSPTFTLINEYFTQSGDFIYHFDFYRIKSAVEAYDFGVEEYLSSGKYCFIEWPERVEGLLPDDSCIVKLEVLDDQTRSLEINV